MEPSADMLTLAGRAAANVTWVLGSDEQVPGLESRSSGWTARSAQTSTRTFAPLWWQRSLAAAS
jgi:hypothetical protein